MSAAPKSKKQSPLRHSHEILESKQDHDASKKEEKKKNKLKNAASSRTPSKTDDHIPKGKNLAFELNSPKQQTSIGSPLVSPNMTSPKSKEEQQTEPKHQDQKKKQKNHVKINDELEEKEIPQSPKLVQSASVPVRNMNVKVPSSDVKVSIEALISPLALTEEKKKKKKKKAKKETHQSEETKEDPTTPSEKPDLSNQSSDTPASPSSQPLAKKHSSKEKKRKEPKKKHKPLLTRAHSAPEIDSVEETAPECPICLTPGDDLIRLKCTHSYHVECLQGQLRAKWTGPRITFNFANCSLCRYRISHPMLVGLTEEITLLEEKIQELAVDKIKEEGLDQGLTGQSLITHSMKTMAFYTCKQCTQPFCGGLVSCAQELEMDVSNLLCQKCQFEKAHELAKKSKVLNYQCKKHGYKFAMFKCDSCCRIAQYDCISNHFCERCHNMAYQSKDFPCPGNEKCDLGIAHPPNVNAVHGSGVAPIPFVIGCTKCLGDEIAANDFYGGQHVF